jgi:hypothetical protein
MSTTPFPCVYCIELLEHRDCGFSIFALLLCLFVLQWLDPPPPEQTKTNSVALSPTDRRLPAKLVPTFVDRRCCVVCATDLRERNLLSAMCQAYMQLLLCYSQRARLSLSAYTRWFCSLLITAHGRRSECNDTCYNFVIAGLNSVVRANYVKG